MKVAVVYPPYYVFWGSRNGWMFQKPLNELSAVNIVSAFRERGDESYLFNLDAISDKLIEGQKNMIDNYELAYSRMKDSNDELYSRLSNDIIGFGADKVYIQVHQGNKMSAKNVIKNLRDKGYSGDITVFGWVDIEGVDYLPNPPEYYLNLQHYVIPDKDYFFYGISNDEFNALEFLRGCRYGMCKFCCKGSIYHRRYIFAVPVKDVMRDVENRIEKYGVRKYYVLDNDFTENEVLREIARIKKEKSMDFSYMCEARADKCSEETMFLLKESGCKRIKLGVEVYDNSALEKLGKGITEKDIDTAVRNARKYGIEVSVYILVTSAYGIGDREYRKTIKWLKKVRPDYITISVLEPYEKTEMYEEFADRMYNGMKDFPAHWSKVALDFWINNGLSREVVDELFSLEKDLVSRRAI